MRRWRSLRFKRASTSGAKSRWRRNCRRRGDGRGGAAFGQGRHSRLQLHSEPRHPLCRQAARRGRDRPGQPFPHRDGRRLHGRRGRAVLLAQRSFGRLRGARRFRRASAEPGRGAARPPGERVRRDGQALRRPPGRRRTARGPDVRHRDGLAAHAGWRERGDPRQPLRLGPQGPPATAGVRRARDDRVRPGAFQRGRRSILPRGARRIRDSAPF